jgi:hypothetical protein
MKKLSKRQVEVIEKAASEPIIIYNHSFCWENGKNVNARMIKNLIEKGHLKYNEDGLMPGYSQTISAVQK